MSFYFSYTGKHTTSLSSNVFRLDESLSRVRLNDPSHRSSPMHPDNVCVPLCFTLPLSSIHSPHKAPPLPYSSQIAATSAHLLSVIRCCCRPLRFRLVGPFSPSPRLRRSITCLVTVARHYISVSLVGRASLTRGKLMRFAMAISSQCLHGAVSARWTNRGLCTSCHVSQPSLPKCNVRDTV